MVMNVKLIDGGFSTQLKRYVGEMDGEPLWTSKFVASNPDEVIKSHLDFLEAGSEYIETCTYQASVYGYCKYLNINEEEANALIQKAGKLAIKAKELFLKSHPDAKIEVVGSIGPYGALLHDGSEYTGDYAEAITSQMIKNTHKARIEQLIKVGITTFAFETLPSKKEAKIFLELLKEFPNIKAWISFSCKDSKSLSNGDNFQETAISCYNQNPQQILAVGVNCSNPVFLHDLFEGINKGRDRADFIPLIAYPNSGEVYTKSAGWQGQAEAQPLYKFVEDWINLGVVYIGGCCRISSSDIEMIKDEIKRLKDAL